MTSIQGELKLDKPKPAEPIKPDVPCIHCAGTGRVAPKTFAERLKALRDHHGWNPKTVSELSGGKISGSNLSNLETGRSRPSVGLLFQLVKIYQTTADYLGEAVLWEDAQKKAGEEVPTEEADGK
jgi:hypothetical protein